MRKTIVGGVVLCLFALGASGGADPIEGSWEVFGKHSRKGKYQGELSFKPLGQGGYRFTAKLVYANNKTEHIAGKATLRKATRTGKKLATEFVRGDPGIIEHLSDSLLSSSEAFRGNYKLNKKGDRLTGSWTSTSDSSLRGTEVLRRARAESKVNLILYRPDGSEVPDAVEETEGEAAVLNWDDDDRDGGKGGDGEKVVVPDAEDTNGVPGENDLLKLKTVAPPNVPTGAKLRLGWTERLAVYKDRDKKERLSGALATFPAEGEQTLYLEGRSPSEPGKGEFVTLELVEGSQVLESDRVRVHVAQAAILVLGDGGGGGWMTEDYGRRKRKDSRTNPWVIRGRDGDGNVAYWSLSIAESERDAKLALSCPNACVAYDGHSNFGMGFAFETGLRTLREFMNIADEQIPVNWPYLREEQGHPQIMFDESEYGDDLTTSAPFDPVQIGGWKVPGRNGTYSTARFLLRPNRPGSRMTIERGSPRWKDHHYALAPGNIRIVVQSGSRDLPTPSWQWMFLNSCYSGQYYYYVFNHGTLYYTTDESSSPRTSIIFLSGVMEGKPKDEILKAVNREENVNDYLDFGE